MIFNKLKNYLFEDEDYEEEAQINPIVKEEKQEPISKITPQSETSEVKTELNTSRTESYDILREVQKEYERTERQERREERKNIETPQRKPRRVENNVYKPKMDEINLDNILNKKEKEKDPFRPSLIISPIYGIIEKKNTTVKIKNEVAREEQELKKTFVTPLGVKVIEEKKTIEPNIPENPGEIIPKMQTVSFQDAKKYYDDLGMEYNVDYKDLSKTKGPDSIEPKPIEPIKLEDTNNEDEDLFGLIEEMYGK